MGAVCALELVGERPAELIDLGDLGEQVPTHQTSPAPRPGRAGVGHGELHADAPSPHHADPGRVDRDREPVGDRAGGSRRRLAVVEHGPDALCPGLQCDLAVGLDPAPDRSVVDLLADLRRQQPGRLAVGVGCREAGPAPAHGGGRLLVGRHLQALVQGK